MENAKYALELKIMHGLYVIEILEMQNVENGIILMQSQNVPQMQGIELKIKH